MGKKLNAIESLVAYSEPGVTVEDMAVASHALAVKLQIPVSFIHNGQRYQARLDIAKVPPREN